MKADSSFDKVDDFIFNEILNELVPTGSTDDRTPKKHTGNYRLASVEEGSVHYVEDEKKSFYSRPIRKKDVDGALFYSDGLEVFGDRNFIAKELKSLGIKTAGKALAKNWGKLDGITSDDVRKTLIWLNLKANRLPTLCLPKEAASLLAVRLCKPNDFCWDPLGRLRKVEYVDAKHDALCTAISLFINTYAGNEQYKAAKSFSAYRDFFSNVVVKEAYSILAQYRSALKRSVPERPFILWALPILQIEMKRASLELGSQYLKGVLNDNLPKEEIPSQFARTLHMTHAQAKRLIADVSEVIEPVNVPFPQADSLEKVIELCRSLDLHDLELNDVSNMFGFTSRQAGYYTNAGIYLGLFRRTALPSGGITLDTLGSMLLAADDDEFNAILARIILRHKPFMEAFRLLVQYDAVPKRSEIAEIIFRTTDCNATTSGRRASTVASWIEWIWRNA